METDTKLVGKKIQKRTFMSFFLLVVFTVLPFFCLQEVHSQLCSQKAQFQCIMDRLKMKYSDTLAPSEIQGQLQEVTQSLQQLEQKVAFWYHLQPGSVQDVILGKLSCKLILALRQAGALASVMHC